MSLETLLVIVPTRGRRANCERMLKSFTETASPGTDILFVSDPDDQDTYKDLDWGDALHAVMEPRGTYITKLNHGAGSLRRRLRRVHVPRRLQRLHHPRLGPILLKALEDMGGHGWVYPENGRRSDVPEHWLASASVIDALGWFAPPHVQMYYGDNIIGELGKRSGLIRYVPEAVIQHKHYTVDPDTPHDETYKTAEDTYGEPDLEGVPRVPGVAAGQRRVRAAAELLALTSAGCCRVLRRSYRVSEHGAGGHRRHGTRVHHPPRRVQHHRLLRRCDHPVPRDEQGRPHRIQRVRRVHLPDDLRRVRLQRRGHRVRAEHRGDNPRRELHSLFRGVAECRVCNCPLA